MSGDFTTRATDRGLVIAEDGTDRMILPWDKVGYLAAVLGAQGLVHNLHQGIMKAQADQNSLTLPDDQKPEHPFARFLPDQS